MLSNTERVGEVIRPRASSSTWLNGLSADSRRLLRYVKPPSPPLTAVKLRLSGLPFETVLTFGDTSPSTRRGCVLFETCCGMVVIAAVCRFSSGLLVRLCMSVPAFDADGRRDALILPI